MAEDKRVLILRVLPLVSQSEKKYFFLDPKFTDSKIIPQKGEAIFLFLKVI